MILLHTRADAPWRLRTQEVAEMRKTWMMIAVAALIAGSVAAQPSLPETPVATTHVTGTMLVVTPGVPFSSATLRVSGPDGYEAIAWSEGGALTLDLIAEGEFGGSDGIPRTAARGLADGRYGYEAVLHLSDGSSLIHSGPLVVANGVPSTFEAISSAAGSRRSGESVNGPGTEAATHNDSVQIYDVAGDGKTSLYLDSETPGTTDPGAHWQLSNEAGGLRIMAGLPQHGNEIRPFSVTTDQRVGIGTTQPQADLHIFRPGGNIRITDSDPCPNGNASWEIEEDFGRLVFEVVANCPGDSTGGKMWIGGTGNVGIGTSSPQRLLQLNSTLPGIRLDDTSGGAGQVDLQMSTNQLSFIGNSGQGVASFDTRAPLGSLWLDQTGNVGIGTSSPSAKLTVHDGIDGGDLRLTGAGGNFLVGIRSDSGDFVVQGPGGASQDFIRVQNGSPDEAVSIGPGGVGIGTGTPTALLHVAGSGRIDGDVALGSSRTLKTGFGTVSPTEVLAQLADLPIASWRYKTEDEAANHIGPFAEDFQRIFGLGDGKTISIIDAQGVAFSAIQALQQELAEREAELGELRNRLAAENAALRQRLELIEALLVDQPEAESTESSR